MKTYTLNIGEVVTSAEYVSYKCLGLGSCIGLFIQDRLTGFSSGAHIFLPDSESGPDNTKFYSVNSALQEIMQQFKAKGSSLLALRAKIAGGATIIGGNSTGNQNVKSVVKHLIDNKIFIAAMDVGGAHARSVKFESKSGLLTVKRPETNEYKIY